MSADIGELPMDSNDLNGSEPVVEQDTLSSLHKNRPEGAIPGSIGSVRTIHESNVEVDEQIPDDDAVLWVWQRIALDGFQKDSWREEHGFIISDFLASPTITRLVAPTTRP